MMRLIFVRLAGLIIALSLLGPFGCLGKGTTQPTRFYHLNPLASSDSMKKVSAPGTDLAIGVGPIQLPEYLDRPQIVTREGNNELQLAEFSQWAESLTKNFSRVFAENLSILLDTERVVIFRWKGTRSLTYWVKMEVSRFDGELGGNASLIARWGIYEEDGINAIMTKRASFTEPVNGKDYESLVAAQSRLIMAFSREVAETIRTLSEGVPGR
ncbi:MAG: membrane integrity-associated transporter subunit PqiC [Deltaproteobacteria bacterium]|nr:MAG: membrane integrity-associated transporter subunit PqiC [Deltaproteobacteria bacterium]